LQALQRFFAAGLHAHAVRHVVGAAGGTHRVSLFLGDPLGIRGICHQYEPHGRDRKNPCRSAPTRIEIARHLAAPINVRPRIRSICGRRRFLQLQKICFYAAPPRRRGRFRARAILLEPRGNVMSGQPPADQGRNAARRPIRRPTPWRWTPARSSG
jgi:hypothetical protein